MGAGGAGLDAEQHRLIDALDDAAGELGGEQEGEDAAQKRRDIDQHDGQPRGHHHQGIGTESPRRPPGQQRADGAGAFDGGEQGADGGAGEADLVQVDHVDRALDPRGGVAQEVRTDGDGDGRDRHQGEGPGVITGPWDEVGEAGARGSRRLLGRGRGLVLAHALGRAAGAGCLRIGARPDHREKGGAPQRYEAEGQPGVGEIPQQPHENRRREGADTAGEIKTAEIPGVAAADLGDHRLGADPGDGGGQPGQHLDQHHRRDPRQRRVERAQHDHGDGDQSHDAARTETVHQHAALDREQERQDRPRTHQKPNLGGAGAQRERP